MSKIKSVHARRIWDSRGRPTVEAEVDLVDGAIGRAIAPAGASRGSGEAVDLRDGGETFGGLDVLRAIEGVNGAIADALIGLDAADQKTVDERMIELDGTENKSRLGGNATVAISMAVAHAAAMAAGQPLWRYLGGENVATELNADAFGDARAGSDARRPGDDDPCDQLGVDAAADTVSERQGVSQRFR